MSSRSEKMTFSKSAEKSERIQAPLKASLKAPLKAKTAVKMSLISFQSKWDDAPKTEKKYTMADHISPENDEMKKISKEANLVGFRNDFSYSCRNAGITSKKNLDELSSKFFGIDSSIQEGKSDEDDKSETESIASSHTSTSNEDADAILERQSILKATGKYKSPSSKAIEKDSEDEEKELTSHDITRAGFVLIMLINRYFHFNKEDGGKLSKEVVEKLREFRKELTTMPSAFDFEHNLPKQTIVPKEFLDNLIDLDIVPFEVNFTVDKFVEYFNDHIEAISTIGLKVNPSAITGCAHPEKCSIVIQNNKVISMKTLHKYNATFIFACSSLSLSKFPKEIKYMPREISAFLEKLPSIGAFYASIQNPSNIRPLTNWTNSEDGAYITAEQIKPSTEYITEIITFASKIVEAIHNTAVNRNSRSEKHIVMIKDHKGREHKNIFKVLFVKYHLFLGHIFGPELSLIEQVGNSLKDFRFMDLSIQIAMVAGLLMIGENTKPLEYASQGFNDYIDLIDFRKGESAEDKKDRISNVNCALYFVIKNLYEISMFGACKNTFTSYETKLYNAWFKNVFELFPKNCKEDSFDIDVIFEDKFDHKSHEGKHKGSKKAAAAPEEYPVMAADAPKDKVKEVKEKPKAATGKGAWKKPIQIVSNEESSI